MAIIDTTADRLMPDVDQTSIDLFPLSMAQQGVWFDQACYGDLPVYNLGGLALLEGPIDLARLAETINLVVRQHDALRLVMHYEDGIPAQRILPKLEVTLPVIDLSGAADPEQAALDYLDQEFQKTFRLEGSPLFSIQLVRVSAS